MVSLICGLLTKLQKDPNRGKALVLNSNEADHQAEQGEIGGDGKQVKQKWSKGSDRVLGIYGWQGAMTIHHNDKY